MGEAAADAKQTYTLTDLKANTTEKSCYLLIDEKVYNVTEFLDEHPGGQCVQLCVCCGHTLLTCMIERSSQSAGDAAAPPSCTTLFSGVHALEG
jgi:Cytochrome b5-like Heme/Steroid binding domain